MHLGFEKSMSTGMVSVTTAGTWDELKYKLTQLSHFSTVDWDRVGFAFERFREGDIICDGAFLWRYVDISEDNITDLEVFKGRVIHLLEIDQDYLD